MWGLLFLCLFQPFLSGAQYSKEVPIQWISPDTIFLGDVSFGSEEKFQLSFINKDTVAVKIDNVRTSCGCTAAAWEFLETLPKQEGVIQLTFYGDQYGDFEKKITVFLDRYRKGFKFWIVGKVN